MKDKYGDVDVNGNDDETDSEDAESEDDDAKELNENVEKEFFKALSLVKSHDPRIYDKEKCRFFDQSEKSSKETSSKKNSNNKAYYLKDLERDMILKK